MSKRHRQLKRARYYARQPEAGLDFDGPCWCGEPHPHYAEIYQTCGGSRFLNCICGGDFCVCHNHGEVECFGCPDCEPPADEENCGEYEDEY